MNIVNATPDQIVKIVKKLNSLWFKCNGSRFSYDSEDSVGFLGYGPENFYNVPKAEWQVRNIRGKQNNVLDPSICKPCFFHLVSGDTRYDVAYPEGVLLKLLVSISQKAIKSWNKGCSI